MKRRVSVFCGVSLDGFIARPDHRLDWLQGTGSAPTPSPEEYGFPAFLARVDALVMGRRTYDVVAAMPGWFYGATPVFVLTHHPDDLPQVPGGHVEPVSGRPEEVVSRLGERGFRRLYVDGGATIQAFLAAGLVDEMIISRLPVLIGDGIPLFGSVPHDLWWHHVETRTFAGGMVQSHYEAPRVPE